MYYVYSLYLNRFIPACAKSFYGTNCTYKCGTNCVNASCDHVTGDCNIDIQVCNFKVILFIEIFFMDKSINISLRHFCLCSTICRNNKVNYVAYQVQ